MAYVARAGDRDTSPVLYVGRAIEEALGYPREVWTDDRWFWSKHLHPEDRARAETWWLGVLSGAVPVGRPSSIEYRMVARDGRAVWFRDRAVLRADGLIHGVMVDVTEEREALERARRAE
ncbi:MAG TPA: PAS domain-containing protein, partial [Actinomycetota bacterium]|nr:PAS domain-containing protein [Actinomycetota bacterium]